MVRAVLALGGLVPVAARGTPEEPKAKAQPPAPEKPEKPEKGPKPRPVNVVVKPAKGQKKAPERAALPGPGEHPAEDLLVLAATLSGKTVRIESQRVRETKVTISAKLAVSHVTFDELALLLAAHRVYLFAVTDPVEGEILVATWDPNWNGEAARRTRIIEVGTRSFKAAWDKVQKAVEARNAQGGEDNVVAIPDERTGKIILGASTDEALEEVARAAAPEEKKDPERPRLYTYVGEHRSAADLEEAVLERLGEGERARVRIVVATKGNRLLLRAPEALWAKIQGLLKELDRKK
jgi:type II secretory pathway component GspD/PulD (secretin)